MVADRVVSITAAFTSGAALMWEGHRTGTQPNLKVKTGFSLPLSGQPHFSESFFSHLTTFVSGVISQYTDLRMLHGRRIAHAAREMVNCYLPPQIKMPAVFVRLADLISPGGDDPGGKKLPRKSWAADYVRIMFWGAQRPALGAAAKSSSVHNTGIVAEAHLRVTDKSKFSLLQARVDRDVTFERRLGIFVLRLRAELGESVIDTLARRLRAIQRLVDFVDAIRQHSKNIRCSKLTLDNIVFSYSDWSPTPPPDAQFLPITILLRRDDEAKLMLGKDNPHLRVKDMLVKLINSPAGFASLHFWLSMTLPVMRTLDKLESNWEQAQMDNQGTFEVFNKTLDWMTLRYTLPGHPGKPRHAYLDLRAKRRQEEPQWHMWRTDGQAQADDEFNKVLRPIWDDQGDGWEGRSTGATALPAVGIETLLSTIDAALRSLVGTPAPPPVKEASPTAADATATGSGTGPVPATKQGGKKQSPQMTRANPSQQQQRGAQIHQQPQANGKVAVVVLD